MTGFNQLLRILVIDILSLALSVRTKISAFARTFINFHPGPFQRINNILFGSLYISGLIGILNSQYKFTVVMAGK